MDFPQPPDGLFADYGLLVTIALPLGALLIFAALAVIFSRKQKLVDGSPSTQELQEKRSRRTNIFAGLVLVTSLVAAMLFSTDLAFRDADAQLAYEKSVTSFIQTHYGLKLAPEDALELVRGNRVEAQDAEGKKISLILLKAKSQHPELARVTGKIEYTPVPPLAVVR